MHHDLRGRLVRRQRGREIDRQAERRGRHARLRVRRYPAAAGAQPRSRRTIDIVFEIREGPRVFVERIDITGNVRTMDKVIRREFRFVEGDAFNPPKLRRSRQRIQDLDFFEKVNVEQVPGSRARQGRGQGRGGGEVDRLALDRRRLLDRQPASSATSASASATSWAAAKTCRPVCCSASGSKQVDLSFTEPYFLGKEIAAGGDLFFVETDRQSESSFDTTTIGGDMRVELSA